MPKDRVTAERKPRPARKPKPGAHPAAAGNHSPGLARLQRQIGNQAVQRLITQRRGDAPATLNEGTAHRVEREKGGGAPLDADVARTLGAALGDNFDDVHIHTDPEADALNRAVGAKAFATGNDLFFRDGEYNPHSAEGRELLAHELTHVVQQKHGQVATSGSGTTVNAPHDVHEQQAKRVSKDLSGGGAEVKRALTDDLPATEEEPLQTAVADDEEEPLQTAATQEEEEPLQMAVADEEEEPLQTAATQEEEEPLQMKRNRN